MKHGTCGNCKHFTPHKKWKDYGECERWAYGYGTSIYEIAKNEVIVENDEGWGAMMGKDFGCVLFAKRRT